jgi:MoxR-like ATPase
VGRQDRPPPIVVATSNSEKQLPPAFLRRCVFHHIELDEALVRRAIVTWRRTRGGKAVARDDRDALELTELETAAMRSFLQVREIEGMEKVPATAELLGWLTALVARGTEAAELKLRLGELPLLPALIKDREDLARIRGT